MDGSPIDEYRFQKSIVAISYSVHYELEQARIYSGISVEAFDKMPASPEWALEDERSKAHILVLYRMSNSIPSAISDAQSREMTRKANQRKGR